MNSGLSDISDTLTQLHPTQYYPIIIHQRYTLVIIESVTNVTLGTNYHGFSEHLGIIWSRGRVEGVPILAHLHWSCSWKNWPYANICVGSWSQHIFDQRPWRNISLGSNFFPDNILSLANSSLRSDDRRVCNNNTSLIKDPGILYNNQ